MSESTVSEKLDRDSMRRNTLRGLMRKAMDNMDKLPPDYRGAFTQELAEALLEYMGNGKKKQTKELGGKKGAIFAHEVAIQEIEEFTPIMEERWVLVGRFLREHVMPQIIAPHEHKLRELEQDSPQAVFGVKNPAGKAPLPATI